MIDQISLEIIRNRLSGIVQEMQANIYRTGYSTIVRESQDASCMVLEATGDVVGESIVLPLHVSALPSVVKAVKRDYGNDIGEGDVFLTNHPYLAGVTHAIDMAVVTPIFVSGRLIAWCASIAHKSDLGGMYAGSGASSAREIFQECVLYPPLRIHHRGRIVQEVDRVLRANSRTPDEIMGDIQGQIGTANLGGARIRNLAVEYGTDLLVEAMTGIQDHTEMALRYAMSRWPDGRAEGESWVDHDGIALDHPVRYHVSIDKRADQIKFDFSGSSDQARGPINVCPDVVRGCCYYMLIAQVDPTIPNNGGVARVVETVFRLGSVLNPRFPASTNTYMASATAAAEALMAAFGNLIPERQVAATGGVGGLTLTGRRQDGSAFVQYELVGSAYGAHVGGDGASGSSVLLDNGKTAPIEILETEFPIRVRRFELIVDSGGPGRWRGGLGIRREYEVLSEQVQLSLRGGKHCIRPAGANGGQDGRAGGMWVNPENAQSRSLPSRFSGVELRAGDVVLLEKAGGGGLGDPRARPTDEVERDVRDGYVSTEAAVHEYGLPLAALGHRKWDETTPENESETRQPGVTG